MAREYSRWPLADQDVEHHLGLSYDYMIEFLGGPSSPALQLDPSGERPLKIAKELRRRVLRDTGRRNLTKLEVRGPGALRPARPPAGALDRASATACPGARPRAPRPRPRALVSGDR